MPTEVAIYTRISEADPEEQTATQRQERSCRAYAEARGWEVVHVYEDVDRSAYRNVQRPAYESLVNALDRRLLDGVVVWRLDRLVRQPRTFESFWQSCESAGAFLTSVTEPVDSSNELGLAIV